MKRSLALILALVMLFGMLPLNAFATEVMEATEATETTEVTEATETTDATEATEATEVTEVTEPIEAAEATEATEAAEETEVTEEVVVSETVQTHTHEYVAEVTDPTCTEQGYTTYTCDCGDSYVDDYVNATGEHIHKAGICTGCGISVLGSDWIAPEFAEGDYSMVVLPDTQNMVDYWPEFYYKQMQWIADNKDTLNIQAVLHMGDMVNTNNDSQWTVCEKGTDILENAGIPWMPMMGNHDDSTWFNKYYDYATYGTNQSWFGGSYHADMLNHTYWFVTVGEREYMILSLGWAPSWDVLTWAQGIVEAHSDKNVILTCHAYMNYDRSLLGQGDPLSASTYLPGYPSGEDVWKAFKDYENIVLAMGGHVSNPDVNKVFVDKNGQSNDVYSLLFDYQDEDIKNRLGMVAVLTFREDSEIVGVNWYSTRYDAVYKAKNQFAITVPHIDDQQEIVAVDISERFDTWTKGGPVMFANGIGYGEDGYTGETNDKLKYSDYVSIEEFDMLKLSVCAMEGYNSAGGYAFYSEKSADGFISFGFSTRHGNGASVDGTSVRTIAVPEGAKYIRITYWRGSRFSCTGYKIVEQCDHEYSEIVTPPTCTEQGYTTYICDCGDSYVNDYVDAAGHSYENGICTGCGEAQPGPSITQQPESVEQEIGKKFAITVKAEGEGLKYQWYYKDAGMKNFGVSSNKSSSYAYTMMAYMHNRQVYCVVTDANGNQVTTETATISRPPQALKIIEQPQDARVNVGEKFSISPKVEGEGLSYQWYVKESGAKAFKVSSNKTSSYAYTMQKYMVGRQVYCVITDKYGNQVTTDVATISLPLVELKILTQPTDVYAAKSEKFSISPEVQGDGLQYQWYYRESYMKDFRQSSNRSSAYAYAMQSYMNNRSVYCVITDQYGNQITTETVTIHLEK